MKISDPLNSNLLPLTRFQLLWALCSTCHRIIVDSSILVLQPIITITLHNLQLLDYQIVP